MANVDERNDQLSKFALDDVLDPLHTVDHPFNTIDVDSDSDECDDVEDEGNESDYVPSDDEEKHNQIYPIETRKKIVNFWWNNGKKRKFKRVQHFYTKLKNSDENLLYSWRKKINNGVGEKKEQLSKIDQFVWDKFKDARENGLLVKETNLKEWALEINRTLGLNHFVASKKWIRNWKNKHGIVSRKRHRV